MQRENELATICVDIAYCIHKQLGPGLLEKTYESCFKHELSKRRIAYETQVRIPISYDGMELTDYFQLDLIVKNKLIIELKSVTYMATLHQAQLLTYLKIATIKLGLLINFNNALIKDGIKRMIYDKNYTH
jgi:GxxExxY protein